MEPIITVVSSTRLQVTNTVTREDTVDKVEIEEQIRQLNELIQKNVRANEENQRKIDELQAKLDLFNLPSVIRDITGLVDGGGGRDGGTVIDDGGSVDGGDVVITNP